MDRIDDDIRRFMTPIGSGSGYGSAHGYQPTDSITVRTFIEQTRNDFDRDAIRELAKQYQIAY